ncbi:DUF898 family protein [Salinibacterium sp. ZJ454]|uniref:DUF898 family protein n=1 Tax=Salinibacterium sp. ZJ454 TaxID=2708339 RepID=UPI00141D973B|nr:DUF898 family protein [Salinibacterium sp. ZJ454]
MARETRFSFDGGAATYFGTAILGLLVTVCTLGICYPFALVLNERWRAKHTFIDGQQLVFTGSATGLFGLWIKWFLLSLITAGIYLFWVGPRIQRWVTVNTEFAKPVAPLQSWSAGQPAQAQPVLAEPQSQISVTA